MSVTCQFNGRLGNILYNMFQVVAYCRRYDMLWYFPKDAWACAGGRVPIQVPDSGGRPHNPTVYTEPMVGGHPYYHDIAAMDNVQFRGYYQSFRYFEDHREYILDMFSGILPYNMQPGVVSLHVRRGDCVAQPDGFPMAPIEYYSAAIRYMQDKGHNRFLVFSDDIQWCREQFTPAQYSGAEFLFSIQPTEVADFCAMMSCEHNITARSTFSLMASWMNRNPDKIVLCPSIEQHYWWRGQNRDLLTGTQHWLTQINW